MAEKLIKPTSAREQLGEWLFQSKHSDAAVGRRGRLLAGVLLFAAVVAVVAAVAVLGFGAGNPTREMLVGGPLRTLFALAAVAALFWLNRQGRTSLAGTLLAILLLAGDLFLIGEAGPLSPNALTLTLPIIIAGFFGPPVSAVAIAVIAVLGYLGLSVAKDPSYLSLLTRGGQATQTLLVYANLLFVAVVSWLFSRTTRQTLEESRVLSLALVAQRQELEQRLEVQTRQLQATTAVSRAVAGSRDVNKLLEDIVRLVRETFGYYHVQVFLVDEDAAYAVLRQSTGDVGQALLARNHRLPVGSMSVIGQVTASGHSMIARDADSDFVHKRNELLPNTRSEMAIPLSVGDKIIGALDMQSMEPDAFADDNLPTFQALADQLAIAIENARLFEQAEDSLKVMRELNREATERSWADFLAEAREEEKHFSLGPETKAMELHRSRVVERVLTSGGVIVSTGKDGRQSFIAAPVVVRNEVVGVLAVEPDGSREWGQADLQLIQSIAERTALAVENARLYIQAQRAAERETMINSIASRLQRAPNLAMLLESAAKELADALGTENVYAEISVDQPLGRTRKDAGQDVEESVAEADAKDSAEPNAPTPDQSEEARA